MLEECGDIYCGPTILKDEFGIRDAEKNACSHALLSADSGTRMEVASLIQCAPLMFLLHGSSNVHILQLCYPAALVVDRTSVKDFH
ncbi:hypothetical protein VNO80_06051 [Phaseolus coccineus]|uniref:Uncharacterized protein n=1 Tax=Phaseolus coccineus TaxID=3886 RepID=A0AAN9RID7_PHACN